MNLTKFLKKKINEQKISVRDLALSLGVSHVTLYNIFKGRNKASNKTMRAIAAHYKIDIREVVELNDNQ